MEIEQGELGGSIRVIVFSSCPNLERGVRQFIVRLEDHPEVDLLAVLCESKELSRLFAIKELWRRRGLLAVPLLLLHWIGSAFRFLLHPLQEIRLALNVAKLSSKTIHVPDIHETEVLYKVRQLAPDLGLIYGSPILKPSLFMIPRLGTLGIHHGKVPEYRGKKTMFWAIYNGERSAGVTIQKVNAGLDTGEIVKHGEVVIGHRFPSKVWDEINELGLNLYLEAIMAIKQGKTTFSPQVGKKGKLYHDPSAGDILELWRRVLARTARDLLWRDP